jgi:hypothetical protein
MRLFPLVTEEFTSPLPPAELLGQLKRSLRPKHRYSGTIGQASFTIDWFEPQNSLLPRLVGRVVADPAGGSRLYLRYALNPYARAVAAGGLLVGGYVGVRIWPRLVAAQAAGQWADFLALALLSVALLGVGTLLPVGMFGLGVRQSRPRLLQLLHLQPAASSRA